MKKSLRIWMVLCIFVIGTLWVFHFFSHEGEFEKLSHTSVENEIFNEREAFYLSYHFKWAGIGIPTLEKMEFIKQDGTIMEIGDDQLSIQSYISKVDFGSFYEKDAVKEGMVKTLLPVKGFKPEDEFSLVLRVELNEDELDSDIDSVRITYKKFGQTQFQNISFNDGIITD